MLVRYVPIQPVRTKPDELAPGTETFYKRRDLAVIAKEQVQQWGKEAGEAAGQVREVLAPALRQVSDDASQVVAQATGSVQALATSGAEQVRRWRAEAGAAIAQITDTAQTIGARGSQTPSF